MIEKEIWLLKSSNQILGPFTYERVVELLRSRQIVIIDEIRDYRSRWSFIREHKQFQEEVQKIREQHAGGAEETSTHVADSEKTSETELTPVPQQYKQEPEKKVPSIPQSAPSKPTAPPAPIYQMATEKRSFLQVLTLALILAVMITGSFIFLQKYAKQSNPDKAVPELSFYEKLHKYSINRETVSLRNLISQAPWPEDQKNLAIAVSFIDESSWDFAKEWIGKAADSWQKEYNLIVMSYLKKEEELFNEKMEALTQPEMPAPLLLMKLYNAFEKSQTTEAVRWKSKNIEEPYRLKYWLLNLFLTGTDGEAYQKLFSLLPNEDELFLKDLTLAEGPLAWKDLADVCIQDWKPKGTSEKVRAVLAFCYIKKGDFVTASDVIHGGLALNPFQAELKLLESFLYSKTARNSQAQVILGDARLQSHPLQKYLKASNCLDQKDFVCSKSLCEDMPDDGFKFTCMIEAQKSLGDIEGAKGTQALAVQKYPQLLKALIEVQQ